MKEYILNREPVILVSGKKIPVRFYKIMNNIGKCEFKIEHNSPTPLILDFIFITSDGIETGYPILDVINHGKFPIKNVSDIDSERSFNSMKIFGKYDLTIALTIIEDEL